MPTGISSLYYLEQPDPLYTIELDNSYFLVRLHEAQALFEAGWLVKPGYLLVSSLVESTFNPGKPMQSVHRIADFKKNTPCRLGLGINLTDWLPARSVDALHIELQYSVVQDTPFKDFLDQMGKLGLTAKLSMARPDLAVALKISEIVGRLLSLSLREGSRNDIFQLKLDLNLQGLKAGYYAQLGSQKNVRWPSKLYVDSKGNNINLVGPDGQQLDCFSYIVLQVLALKRKGEEIERGEAWWELLQAGKDQALAAYPINEQEQRKALDDWRSTLSKVRAMANKECSCLLNETQEIIRKAQVEVQKALMPSTSEEAYGNIELPEAWQNILGVSTEKELYSSVRDYQDSLELSKTLLEHYKSLEADYERTI